MGIKNKKNKLSTPGYFIKRLRDSNFVVLRVFQDFSDADPRRWVVLVDPGNASVFITCYESRVVYGEYTFEFNDGNQFFKNSPEIKTDTIETVVSFLLENNVGLKNVESDKKFIKD